MEMYDNSSDEVYIGELCDGSRLIRVNKEVNTSEIFVSNHDNVLIEPVSQPYIYVYDGYRLLQDSWIRFNEEGCVVDKEHVCFKNDNVFYETELYPKMCESCLSITKTTDAGKLMFRFAIHNECQILVGSSTDYGLIDELANGDTSDVVFKKNMVFGVISLDGAMRKLKAAQLFVDSNEEYALLVCLQHAKEGEMWCLIYDSETIYH